MKAEGFAVVDNTGLNVRSVSPTERAAMVNWLVVAAHCVVYDGTADNEIAATFQRYARTYGAKIRKVSIEVIE